MHKRSILKLGVAAVTLLAAVFMGSAAYAQAAPSKTPPANAAESKKADDAADKKTKEERAEARKERREHRKAVNHRQRRKH